MKIRKAYKFRVYPNKSQQDHLIRQFGSCRFVYNYFLRKRMDHYVETGKGLSWYDTIMLLVKLKRNKDYLWLKEAHSQTLQGALRDLDQAYTRFFRKQNKYPKFKKKHGKQSCRYPQGFKVVDSKVYLPKIGWVRAVIHRPIEGLMKNLTVSKTKTGKYFISIQVEQVIPDPEYQGEVVGLDLGLNSFVVLSNGIKIGNPRYFSKAQRKLKRLQQQLSRTKEGSRGREKARVRVALQHEKIANQRSDFQHKLSRKLVEENQFIAIEDLSIKGMLRNHRLAKSISDAGWYQFVTMLEYKGLWYGCKIGKVDRFFPSSKRCHVCGWMKTNLTLGDRTWTCEECNTIHDRDINAAKNILAFCTAGVAETKADGERVRLELENPV